jgi:hypothetical protein
VSINEFVPVDHLLRLNDKYIDFSFLLKKLLPFYSEDNGRPSDPLIQLSEASQTQKSCMGFAIAGYGD